jgi:hypothetical protein
VKPGVAVLLNLITPLTCHLKGLGIYEPVKVRKRAMFCRNEGAKGRRLQELPRDQLNYLRNAPLG